MFWYNTASSQIMTKLHSRTMFISWIFFQSPTVVLYGIPGQVRNSKVHKPEPYCFHSKLVFSPQRRFFSLDYFVISKLSGLRISYSLVNFRRLKNIWNYLFYFNIDEFLLFAFLLNLRLFYQIRWVVILETKLNSK